MCALKCGIYDKRSAHYFVGGGGGGGDGDIELHLHAR